MNLLELDSVKAANEGSDMQVVHPATGMDIDGLKITLLGSDSDTYRKESNAISRRGIRNGKRVQEVSEDEKIDRVCELFAKITVGWKNVDGEDGKPLKCNFDNAKAIYKKLPWLREQVANFIADRANFIKA